MELIKWQNVIVEWVNCLNLSKPVQTIDDLKDEVFFRKLLQLVTPNQADRSEEDLSLIDFLKKHYPAYSLEIEPTFIQDNIEICNICSLLLHYCCLLDGRQEFITPLCKELNTTSQFHIKSFLEDLQESKEITRELLNDAISSINKYLSTPTKLVKNSPLNSPKIPGNTALLEFLKTPLKKQQCYDSHKKEIKQLQFQLDLERFEKADLQEELNLQYERNKKLDKTISEKQTEISRFRSELLCLESRTPPSNTKQDGRIERKILRAEITSLEKYIQILHKEQEEIQNERDKAREKLRKIEENCNEWQSKALNSERLCSKITEENEIQRNELIQLREKCEELSSILKEVHAKNVCDESYEIDQLNSDFMHNRSGSIDYDSLAHTVVDVQLIDAQEENKNLRKQLSELDANTAELATQVSQLQSEINKVTEENKTLLNDNNNLAQKLLDTEKEFQECDQILKQTEKQFEHVERSLKQSQKQFEECQHTLKQTEKQCQECQQTLKQIEEENTYLKTSVVELQSKLSETELNLIHNINENETLINDLNTSKIVTNTLDKKLTQKVKEFDLILVEKNSLQVDFNESVEKIRNFESENALLKEFIDKFNNVFEIALVKFETELKKHPVEAWSKNDDISKLERLITVLERKIKEDAISFEEIQEQSNALTNRISNLTNEVSSLTNEISTLYNNEVESKKENNNLKACLDDAKSKIHRFEEQVANNDRLISNLKSTIVVKSNEISAMKDVLINKDKQIEDIKGFINTEISNSKISLQDAGSKICELESIIEDKLEDISALQNTIAAQDQTIDNLNCQKNDLTVYLEKTATTLSEEMETNQLAEAEIEKLNTCLKSADSKIEDLQVMVNNNEKLINIYKATIEENNSEISSLKDMITSKDISIEKHSSEISSLKDVLVAKDKIIEDADEEKCNLSSCLKTVENELSEEKRIKELVNNEISNLKKSLQDAESQIHELETSIEENFENISGLQIIITSQKQTIDNLNSEKNHLTVSLEKAAKTLSEEIEAKKIAQTETEKLKTCLKNVESNIQDLKAIAANNSKLIHATEEKSVEISSLKRIIMSKDKFIEENSKEISSLKDVLVAKDKIIEDIDKEKCNLSSCLKTVQNELAEGKRIIEIVSNEISNLKISLQDAGLKINELKINIDEKEEVISRQEQTIEKLINEKNNLTVTLENTAKTLFEEIEAKKIAEVEKENLKICLKNVESNIQDIQVFVNNNKKLVQTIDENIVEISSLKQIIMTKDKFIDERTSEISAMKDVLDAKDKLIEDIDKEKFNVSSYLKTVQDELFEEKRIKELINDEISSSRTSLQDAGSRIFELESSMEKKSEDIIALQNIITTHEQTIDNINREKNNLSVSLEKVTKKLSEEMETNQLAEADIEKLKIRLKTVESNIQDLEGIVDNNNKLINTYKATIDEKSNELNNMVAEKNKFIEDLYKEKCNLVNNLESIENNLVEEKRCTERVRNDCQKIKNDLIERDNLIKHLENQKTCLETNVESLNNEITSEKKCNTELEEKCRQLQSIITEAELRMQDLNNDKIKLNHEIVNVNKNKNDVEKKLDYKKLKLKSKIENLSLELKHADESKQILKEKLDVMTKSLEEKNNYIFKLEENKTDLLKQIETLGNDLSEKNKQKDEIEIQLKDLTKSLSEKEMYIQTLESEKNNIKGKIELLTINLTSQESENSNKILEQIKINHEFKNEIDTMNQNFNMIAIEVSTIVNMLKTEEDIHFNIELEQIHNDDSFVELSKTISNLKNNICSLIFEKRRLDNETTSLQQHISALENIKSNTESESSKTITDLTNQCEKLKTDNDKYKSRKETYRQKLDDMEKALVLTETNVKNLLTQHNQEIEKYQVENKQLKENMSSFSEVKNNLVLKLDQANDNFSKTLEEYYLKFQQHKQEIEDTKTKLNDKIKSLQKYSMKNEKTIQELKEKVEEKDKIITVQEQEVNKINLAFTKFVKMIQNKLLYYLAYARSHVNNLDHIKQEFSENIQQNTSDVEEIMELMKTELINMNKERINYLEIKKQLENKVESVMQELCDISSDQEKLICLCKESHNKMHSIYTLVFENDDQNITDFFNNLKIREKQLSFLYDEKILVSNRYDLITKEIINLKKTFKDLSNYDTLKSEHESLKIKFNEICDIENNALKAKLSEIENKLSDLQLENATCKKQLSDKEVDLKSIKDKYEEELNLMKGTCANRQKTIKENEAEHEKLQNDHKNLKAKYDTELEDLHKSNCKLEEIVVDLEQIIKQNNNVISEYQTKYQELNKKYETAIQKISTLDPEILNLQDKINHYKKLITNLESDNNNLTKNFADLSEEFKTFSEKCKSEHSITDKDEVVKLRSVYSDLMAENSHLQLDCTVLKKTVEDRNNQLSNLNVVQDAYKKLLEENNKANMELDTLRYKRTRDKEEFKRVLEESNSKSDQTIQEIKSEYEEKFKKMKEKIVKLYREEVEKEKKKVCTLQQGQAEETISKLKSQLWMTGNKYVNIKKENEKLREQLFKSTDQHQFDILDVSRGSDFNGSRDSVCSLRERRPNREIEERRTSTLPKDMKSCPQQFDIIEDTVTISRKRRSITTIPKNLDHGLKMEDEEGELFNNTYLADLKAGRCVLSNRDSINTNGNRLSELQIRNSMCPPHLKSSYPAETQFTSPGQFKEEDIKMGTADLNDSMSSSLLPGEKPRTKKDWGQTLYKKPGPPTPSKNGGRLSLQGNEVHPRDVLREHNPGRTTSTPSRIKALFSRSGATSRDTENVSTPRGQTKRRSIFRR